MSQASISDLIFWNAHTAWIYGVCKYCSLSIGSFITKSGLDIYLFRVLIRRQWAHKALCHAAFIYQAVKSPIPVAKTSPLWMRVWSEDLWDIVLLHFTDDERKDNFRISWVIYSMTLHSTKTTAHSMHHTLCHFYIIAHAQYFLVLVFNPIKFYMSS